MISILATSQGPVLAAIAPLLLLVVGFDAFCLVDLARVERVSYLPRWAWAVLCVVISPWAGIAYLAVGRSR